LQWIAVLAVIAVFRITFAIIHAATQPSQPAATAPTVTPSAVVTAPATSTPSATADVPAPTETAAPAPAPTAAPPPAVNVALPNARFTPGQAFVGVTASQVCTSGWASAHRHVTQEQYYQVYGEYGIHYPQPYGTYELDHLIPLELGGDNDNANLWPEPASPTPGFHEKDDLENALHDMVCSGALSLSAAQHAIATNWYAAYQAYVAR